MGYLAENFDPKWSKMVSPFLHFQSFFASPRRIQEWHVSDYTNRAWYPLYLWLWLHSEVISTENFKGCIIICRALHFDHYWTFLIVPIYLPTKAIGSIIYPSKLVTFYCWVILVLSISIRDDRSSIAQVLQWQWLKKWKSSPLPLPCHMRYTT